MKQQNLVILVTICKASTKIAGQQQNTYWLRKSDYVRLKNIELGYTLPESVTSSILVKNFRVYLSAFNLLTYSPHIDDYDPESTSGSGYNYPLNKVVNVGASINF